MDSLEYIGRYKVLGILGRGSMGVVYKAQDPNIGRTVAIKTLRKAGISNEALERFKNEARSAGNLRHPNIVTVFDVNIQGDNPYIVMDLVDGEGLDLILSKRKKLRADLVLYYLKQIASGLDAAHAKGVVHRDIKPSNIIIDHSETCYIADFGVATITAGSDGTESGNIVGTPGYMAPEQIQNKAIDSRTDLFSLAIVAFECFTGYRPFPGNSVTEVLGNILNAPPISLTSLADLPLALEAEFEKALAKSPQNRYPTGEILVHKFAEALGIYRIDKPLVSHFEEDSGEEEIWQKMPSHSSTSSSTTYSDSSGTILNHASNTTEEDSEAETISYSSNSFSYTDPSFRGDAKEEEEEDKEKEMTPGAMFQYGDQHTIASFNRKEGTNKRFLFFVVMILVLAGIASSGIVLLTPAEDEIEYVENEIVVQEPEQQKVEHVDVSWKVISELSNEEIMALLSDKSSEEKNILEALEEVRKRLLYDFVDVAESLMESDSYQIRYNTLKTIKVLKNKDTLPLAITALNDYDALVRGEAANVIGSFGSRNALGALVTNYKSEEVPEVKIALKRAIEKINGYPYKE